jgi:hypothetical protein
MEASMRLRSISSVVLVASSFALAAHGSRAVAQIEFARSTIRITSASEPATPEIPVQARQQLEPISSNTAAAEEPAKPVARYDVRPVSFEAPVAARPLAQPQATSRAPSLVGVYAGSSARATLSKMPGPAPVQQRASAPPKHPRGKPFQSVQNEPAVSPYLNLYRTETNGNNLPNYFAFVRPQLDQMQANRQQTAELQKLRGQLQNISSAGPGAPQSARMGASARYMDTAQFYGGLRR